MGPETGPHQPRLVDFGFGKELLDGFDVADEESHDFLGSLIASGRVPSDAMAELADLALMRGQEEWDMTMACAASLRDRVDPASRDRGRLLGCLRALRSVRGELVCQHFVPDSGKEVSRFWAGTEGHASCRPEKDLGSDEASTNELPGVKTEVDFHVFGGLTRTAELGVRTKRWAKSPFFKTDPNTKKNRRPRAGTVSGLPMPPLSAPRFGLIQEEFAHDPFGLLVAVTFLIKTTGKVAIPTLRAFTARFPDAESVAAADPEADVKPMIRHLGLATRRCAALQRSARSWMARPPTRAVRYVVKNYPRPGDARDLRAGEAFGPEDGECECECERRCGCERGKDPSLGFSWEVGHITQGRYALDSWRIFCRDMMLGRSEDWTGHGGCRDGFQPEWMRVLPEDKELRACLRWMWMKEGWAWDPKTGDREVLGEEVRLAVDEGRITYDESGNLVILDRDPQQESGT